MLNFMTSLSCKRHELACFSSSSFISISWQRLIFILHILWLLRLIPNWLHEYIEQKYFCCRPNSRGAAPHGWAKSEQKHDGQQMRLRSESTSGNLKLWSPCSKQGQPEQLVQECVWSGLDRSKDGMGQNFKLSLIKPWASLCEFKCSDLSALVGSQRGGKGPAEVLPA